MRLAAALAGVALLALCLAGCGSSGDYADSARSAVKTMSAAIGSYDAAHPGDVASTGAACREAGDALGPASAIASETPPSQFRALGAALARVYASARVGFTDCAAGASSGSYVLMARADSEIATANSWIKRARSLDR